MRLARISLRLSQSAIRYPLSAIRDGSADCGSRIAQLHAVSELALTPASYHFG